MLRVKRHMTIQAGPNGTNHHFTRCVFSPGTRLVGLSFSDHMPLSLTISSHQPPPPPAMPGRQRFLLPARVQIQAYQRALHGLTETNREPTDSVYESSSTHITQVATTVFGLRAVTDGTLGVVRASLDKLRKIFSKFNACWEDAHLARGVAVARGHIR